MSPFTWNDSYSVGNTELDSHHQRLFDIFSRLYDQSQVHYDLQAVAAILNELDSYAKYHFKTEEVYMRRVGFDDSDRHVCMHNYFNSRVSDINRRITEGNIEACRELIFFLGNWLKHHVIEEDKRIART